LKRYDGSIAGDDVAERLVGLPGEQFYTNAARIVALVSRRGGEHGLA
jgi:hypothetical protein